MKDEKKSEKKDVKKDAGKDAKAADKSEKKAGADAKKSGSSDKKVAADAKKADKPAKKDADTEKKTPKADKPAVKSDKKPEPKNLAEQALSAVSNAVDTVKDSLEKLDFTDIFDHADSVKADKDTRAKLFEKACGFIPGKISNATVISVFELMRKQQRLMKKDFSAHLKKNKDSFEKHIDSIKKSKGFIEDQSNWKDILYGDSTMQYSGCEIFATFNAIWSILGKSIMSIPELISEFEKDGMVLSGKFGTAPKAMSDLLERHGFKTELCTDEKEFDAVGKRNESMILTMYNDKNDISQEVHTINISKKNGKYTAHNTYCNGKVLGPFDSISETISSINNGKAKGISLIGIRQK